MPAPFSKVPDAQFVAIWQQASTLLEVAQFCGYATPEGRKVASNRARRLRRMGVRLKRMNGTTPGEVRRLNLIVRRLESRREP